MRDWRLPVAIAALGSAVLLAAALAFQHLGGLAPCQMCIWQRWPHAIAVVLGALALGAGLRWPALAGALVMLAGAGIGAWHAGFEQGWLPGPASCSGAPVGDLTAEELMARIMSAPLVRCDEIVWSFAGISMAGWNAILSLGLALTWFAAFRAGGRDQARSSASQ